MEKYAWLFPILFVFHDFEEIVGVRLWLERNGDMLRDRYPLIYKYFRHFSTDGFALAVYEEFLVITGMTIAALCAESSFMWYVWFGGFAALTFHYVVHIVQAVILRRYIPAVVTSVICLPISIYIIYDILNGTMSGYTQFALGTVVGALMLAVNMIFALRLVGVFKRSLTQK